MQKPDKICSFLLGVEIRRPRHLIEVAQEGADEAAGALGFGLNPLLGEDLGAAHGAGAVVLVPLPDAGPAYLVPAAE